jgi:hypothetical protein
VRALLAVVLAAVAASMYALSTSLQALEARRAPRSESLRASLIAGLARRRLWLAGTVAGILAWPLQAGALSLGSVALVQPALGFGLVVLLVLGVRVLHESIGAREMAGVLAVVAAVAILGWAAPAETGSFTSTGTWLVGLAAVVVAPAPYLLRLAGRPGGLPTSIAAGLGWAWVGLGTSLLDDAVGGRHWLAALGWAAAIAAASWGSLVDEMTSLQTWPATRAIPISFGLEMTAPAALAPFLTHRHPPHTAAFVAGLALACVGAVALGGSRAVARAAVPLTEP